MTFQELGIDILNEDNGQVVHRKVSARVDYTGLPNDPNNLSGQPYHTITLKEQSPYNTSGVGINNSYSNSNGNSLGNINNNSNGSGNGNANGQLHNPVNGLHATNGRQNITIDMVVKKLSHDLKLSKLVAADLRHTSDVFAAMRSQTDLGTSPGDDQDFPPYPHDLGYNGYAKSNGKSHASSLHSHIHSPHTSSSATSVGSSMLHESHTSLLAALEGARRDLEHKTAKVEELEAAISAEREARLLIEEKWREAIYQHKGLDLKHVDDEFSEDGLSDNTVSENLHPEIDEVENPLRVDLERVENSLRAAHEEVSVWRARAEVAETEHNTVTSRILEMTAELEASRSRQVASLTEGKAKSLPPKSRSRSRTRSRSPRMRPNEKRANETSAGISALGLMRGSNGALLSALGVVLLGFGLMTYINEHSPKPK